MSTAKLDPEFKAAWVAALRSGKYEQGFGALNPMKNHYCCLGVACIAAGTPIPPYGYQSAIYNWLDSLGVDTSQLMSINDLKRDGFPKIADYIEKTY